MFTAFSPCLGHDKKKFARSDDRLVALVYGMTVDFRHGWDLPVLHYHEIMVIYPYPFFGGNYPIFLLDNIY